MKYAYYFFRSYCNQKRYFGGDGLSSSSEPLDCPEMSRSVPRQATMTETVTRARPSADPCRLKLALHGLGTEPLNPKHTVTVYKGAIYYSGPYISIL